MREGGKQGGRGRERGNEGGTCRGSRQGVGGRGRDGVHHTVHIGALYSRSCIVRLPPEKRALLRGIPIHKKVIEWPHRFILEPSSYMYM